MSTFIKRDNEDRVFEELRKVMLKNDIKEITKRVPLLFEGRHIGIMLQRMYLQFVLHNMKNLCEDCSRCCHELPVVRVSEYDIERLSSHLGITPKELKKTRTKIVDGLRSLRNTAPCEFLDKGSCQIYDVRPTICIGYPFLTLDDAEHSKHCKSAMEVSEIFDREVTSRLSKERRVDADTVERYILGWLTETGGRK